METTVVYKEASDHARAVSDFMRDFKKQTGRTITTLNPDSREGAHFCEVHDIMIFPTIIATDTDGRQLQVWRGLPLPTISEVSYYAL